MDDLEKDFEIDWAFHICDMGVIRLCIGLKIDLDELKPIYKAGWIAGNRRASAAAEAALARINSTLETVG